MFKSTTKQPFTFTTSASTEMLLKTPDMPQEKTQIRIENPAYTVQNKQRKRFKNMK